MEIGPALQIHNFGESTVLAKYKIIKCVHRIKSRSSSLKGFDCDLAFLIMSTIRAQNKQGGSFILTAKSLKLKC